MLIPYCIINLIIILTDKHIYKPSSKNLLIANGSHLRKPQLDTTQRSWGTQSQWTHQHHSSCICGIVDIEEEGP